MIPELTRGEAADFLSDNLREWPKSDCESVCPAGWKWRKIGSQVLLFSDSGLMLMRAHWEIRKRFANLGSNSE